MSIEEIRTIRINTKPFANLTSDKVPQALKLRNKNLHGSSFGAGLRIARGIADYKEPKADMQPLLEQAPERLILLTRLSET